MRTCGADGAGGASERIQASPGGLPLGVARGHNCLPYGRSSVWVVTVESY